MSEPTWKPVPGYEGRYEVSDLGAIRSLVHRRPRILKPAQSKHGYLCVNIYPLVGKRRRCSVHQLVAAAFIGPRPPKLDVRHRNGIKTDCRASNLEFGTRSENMLDAVRHGQVRNAAKTHCGVCETPYDAANTYHRPDGGRECRRCAARRRKAYELKKQTRALAEAL